MARIERVGDLSYDEHEVIEDFLQSYDDCDVLVPDEYLRYYNALPIFQYGSNPKSCFRESEAFLNRARFHRTIPRGNDNYHVDLRMEVNNNIWLGKSLTIKKNDEEYHEVGDGTFSPSGHYYSCSPDVVGDLLSAFNSKIIMPAEEAYIDRIRDYHGVFNGLLEANDWDSLAYEIEGNPSIGNLILNMSNGDIGNNYFGAQYGTVLYQLLTYRNEHCKSLSKESLEKLDNLIMSVKDGEILGLKLEGDDEYYGIITELHLALKKADSYSISLKSQLLTPQNGDAIEEQKTLMKIIKNQH